MASPVDRCFTSNNVGLTPAPPAHCHFFSSNSWSGGTRQDLQHGRFRPHLSDQLSHRHGCYRRTHKASRSIRIAMAYAPSVGVVLTTLQRCPLVTSSAIGVHMIRLRSMADVLLPCSLRVRGSCGKFLYEIRRTFVHIIGWWPLLASFIYAMFAFRYRDTQSMPLNSDTCV